MTVSINIDIENARKALKLSAGSLEETKVYENYTDEEIKDKVISHCRCWGITESKDEANRTEIKKTLNEIIDNESQFEEIWDKRQIPESNVKESYETYVIPVDTIKMILDKYL